jgi:hypothetical protein
MENGECKQPVPAACILPSPFYIPTTPRRGETLVVQEQPINPVAVQS